MTSPRWWEALLARFRPRRIDDPVFGSLLFMSMPDPSKSYWEGAGTFPPTGDRVEYFVGGSEEGPGTAQRAFFRSLLDCWSSISDGVRPVLQKGWHESGRPPSPPPTFRLACLSIPRVAGPECEWELGFESPEDTRRQLFSVTMGGWKPTGEIAIDG